MKIIDKRLGRSEELHLLDKLPYAAGAAFDSRDNLHDQCLENTRVDLLNQIHTWANDVHDKDIFWLKGIAGTGKSTIARTVAYSLKDQGLLGASFFFSRGKGDRGHAKLFFTSLAVQLAELHPSIKPYVCEAIADHPRIVDKNLQEQWTHLIYEPLLKVRDHMHPLILVIDALDECENENHIRDIITHITQKKEWSPVQLRVFITSRPETSIRLGFRETGKAVLYDLALDMVPQPVIERDICTFIQYHIGEIRKNRRLREEWPGAEKISILVQRAGRLFIYAATLSVPG